MQQLGVQGRNIYASMQGNSETLAADVVWLRSLLAWYSL